MPSNASKTFDGQTTPGHLGELVVSLPRVTTLPGKSWNLVRPFSRPGKSWKTAKVMESHGK